MNQKHLIFNAEDVVLNRTGTAEGTVSTTRSGAFSRTVTISNLVGDGTLAISLPADIAQDIIGNRNNPTNTFPSFKLGCEAGSKTFNFTGSSEQFTVPDRCSSIVVTIQGGAGGSGAKTTGQTPTPGGKIKGAISADPGIIFNVLVQEEHLLNQQERTEMEFPVKVLLWLARLWIPQGEAILFMA